MGRVAIELFGNMETVEFIENEELLKQDVRYLGTDYEMSGLDIFEDRMTGDLFATKLQV